MTYEEALELFNSREYEDAICNSNLCDYKNTGCCDCKYTHMELTIIEALEKQIPKKPTEYEDKFYACPVCGNVLLHKWEEHPAKLMSKDKGLPYCLDCGQRIDWSDIGD